MKHLKASTLLTAVTCSWLFALQATAQLSSNPDKFLGNITTSYQIDYGSEKFYQLWNQITPENESKWDQIEGNRNSFTWGNCDRIYKYAKQHNFPFKFHTLVWGSQYPRWMDNLSKEQQLKEIVQWMDAIKKRYPDLQMIDVVNEAVPGHAPAPYKEALGGDGATGYDWIIRAFEMAQERWPDAILIYNDYNTFQWNTDQFITLVRTLRDAGAPIDAYGCQAHDLNYCAKATLQASMKKIQDALKMPMYVTEYDSGIDDDNAQLNDYKNHIPLMWEADYCAGVTLWGYIYGKTWTNDGAGYSGIIKDGQDRPAMTWLRQYMQSDKAKTAKSPFPGMAKEASVYVKPQALRVPMNRPATIEIQARMKTKTIEKVEFYVNNGLRQTLTEAPYIAEFTPTGKGKYNLKAVVTTTDGTKYERLSSVTSYVDYGDIHFSSLSQLEEGVPFAIVSMEQGKALYGTDLQNLGFDTFDKAFADNVSGYYYKVEKVTVNGSKYYLLRLQTPAGGEYEIWGNPGYLNTQPADQQCSFILGLNNQNGQDFKNGAVWDIKYVKDRGFTLRNVGTGLYLHDNGPAKYDEPAYFSFCTKVAATSDIKRPTIAVAPRTVDGIYSLQGVRVADADELYTLPVGIYIVNGKKIVKR